MSRAMFKRLEKLEQQRSSDAGRYHLVLGQVGDDDETFEARVESFKATLPDYDEDRDIIMGVQFVSPSSLEPVGKQHDTRSRSTNGQVGAGHGDHG